jgi:cob(I)alamin adenosyltransferase
VNVAEPSEIGAGYVHIYTGEGKGKTTAALGLALRAVGNGLRVLVLQFLKGGESGEREAAVALAPLLQIRSRGGAGFVTAGAAGAEDVRMAKAALAEAREEMLSSSWDLLVLDEVNTAVSFGLLPVEAVVRLIEKKPAGLELVLTGRHAPAELVARADLVTEMKDVRHYFRKGVAARKGIEK